MSAKIMHAPQPGPLYWDWRCLICDRAVSEHAGLLRRIIYRLRKHPVESCHNHTHSLFSKCQNGLTVTDYLRLSTHSAARPVSRGTGS